MAERYSRAMTHRHVSLLRGINVGGHNLISMARLRALYVTLGCEDVETYLQSGNVVFRRDRDVSGVGRRVERAIKRELGLDVRVFDRSQAELAAIVDADPFPDTDPSRHIVMFLAGPPGREIARELEHVRLGSEEAVLVGMEMHLHCPDGVGDSRLAGMITEKRLGVAATARNWRTVTRLTEMSARPS
jgi:uncharacterized protein (DUF1697 family)